MTMGVHNVQSVYWRLGSMAGWHLKYVYSIAMLALAGFCYRRIDADDLSLQCVYCLARINKDFQFDNPFKEHIRISPRCMHMICTWGTTYIEMFLRQENINFELDPDIVSSFLAQGCVEYSPRNEKFYIPEPFGRNGPVNRVLQSNIEGFKPIYSTLLERSIGEARHWDKGSWSERRSTLQHMQEQLANVYAGCGFFWHESILVCYFCGCTFDIHDSELQSDPWKKHAQASDCGHVTMVKGTGFLPFVREGKINHTTDYDADQDRVISDMIDKIRASLENPAPRDIVKRHCDSDEDMEDDEPQTKRFRDTSIQPKSDN